MVGFKFQTTKDAIIYNFRVENIYLWTVQCVSTMFTSIHASHLEANIFFCPAKIFITITFGVTTFFHNTKFIC